MLRPLAMRTVVSGVAERASRTPVVEATRQIRIKNRRMMRCAGPGGFRRRSPARGSAARSRAVDVPAPRPERFFEHDLDARDRLRHDGLDLLQCAVADLACRLNGARTGGPSGLFRALAQIAGAFDH